MEAEVSKMQMTSNFVMVPVEPCGISLRKENSLWDRIIHFLKNILSQERNMSLRERIFTCLSFIFPIFEWLPNYTLPYLRADIISGITIASLAIPQGISYAGLAKLPPIIGLYSSFVPPIIYTFMGSSRDLAVGTIAVVSLIFATKIGEDASPEEETVLYISLVFTATLAAGIIQTALGLLRLGFIIDFLSHATILGFMGGAATIVCLQQLKVFLGFKHFTTKTDIASAIHSVSSQINQSRWECFIMGLSFLAFLLFARYIGKRKPKLFTVTALAPLLSVILASLLVFSSKGQHHGIEIVGDLKRGLNPSSVQMIMFNNKYFKSTLKTGFLAAIISLTEGIAVGRTFSAFKNYHIDGNKEMIAIGIMNIVGSCTSCYITTGPFSRSAVNFNAGCKTAMSNMVMAVTVMMTLLFMTSLFYYTPMVVLSAIIVSAMLGLIDIRGAYHLWKVDKPDFIVCITAYLGVIFTNVQMGLAIAVTISLLRLILNIARPKVFSLQKVTGTSTFRNKEQYIDSSSINGILIISISSPILFANSNYIRQRILGWVEEKTSKEEALHTLIIEMTGVTTIDSSGVCMLMETMRNLELRCVQLAMVNPGIDVVEKIHKCHECRQLVDAKAEHLFLTVEDAINFYSV